MFQTLLDKTNKLKLYLCCSEITGKDFAKAIGYTPQMICGYLAGKRKLSHRAAKLIEIQTEGMVKAEDILSFNPPEPETVKKEVEQKVPETV